VEMLRFLFSLILLKLVSKLQPVVILQMKLSIVWGKYLTVLSQYSPVMVLTVQATKPSTLMSMLIVLMSTE